MKLKFGIPPKGWSQAEAFRKAYDALRTACEGSLHRGFHSPQEVADYLNLEIQWSAENPVTAATIRRWVKSRNFPALHGRRRKDWFTTNLHLLAFLRTYRNYDPKRAYAPTTPEECDL